MTDPISIAQAEKLLPDWIIHSGTAHTAITRYARPAVAEALSELRAEIAKRDAEMDDALKLLVRIRDHFLFADDDGGIGVSDAIDEDLFNNICAAINKEQER